MKKVILMLGFIFMLTTNAFACDSLTECKEAARFGDADALYEVGVLYEQKGDIEEAIKWYGKAARAGKAEAQYNLGVLNSGMEVYDNERLKMAAMWYGKAARNGYDHALFWLAKMYDEGRGVNQDDVKAYAYYNISDKIFDAPDIKRARDEVEQRMSLAQIKRAEELTTRWLDKYRDISFSWKKWLQEVFN